jgi:drug/metabolite transporter (DMT)-like permease
MRRWAITTALATFLFGLNAAFIEVPEKFIHPPFPTTLGYVVWSLMMALCAAVALQRVGWRLEISRKAVLYGAGVGLLGAAGQILLFLALRDGPAYIVVPIASLYPALTVVLAVVYLREQLTRLALGGIVLALVAILLLSVGEPSGAPIHGWHWLFFCILTLAMWGVQAYLMKTSAGSVSEESLFFYMAVSAVLLAPAALPLTDLNRPINWHWEGPGLTALIQLPNAVAALLQIYAYREGKIAIVAPVIALYPVVTIVLSLLVYRTLPDTLTTTGMLLALGAIFLIARAESRVPQGA